MARAISDSYELVEPSGDTSLAAGLVQLLKSDPDVVFVLSDGYENAPAGRFGKTVAAVRRIGIQTPIHQFTPVFAAESQRRSHTVRFRGGDAGQQAGSNWPWIAEGIDGVRRRSWRGGSVWNDQGRWLLAGGISSIELSRSPRASSPRIQQLRLEMNEVFRKRKKTTASSKIDVREVLRGCEAGRLQSVGYMQVIPLVSDLYDDRFVSPVQCDADVYTTSYGTLGFRNSSDSVMIVPCHAGYVVKQHAQDHAMAHAGVVAAAGDRRYDTAVCIQASQGGFIEKGSYRMLILPHALREHALQLRKTKNYQKLWDDISVFNRSLGVQGQGHLEYFLKAFKKELDEFVAEFECVPNAGRRDHLDR